MTQRTEPAGRVPQNLWGMVLAGGHGRRVLGLMRRLNGSDLPKQFSAVIGRRSMLQHTLDRAATYIPRDRILTVIIQEHLLDAREQLTGWPSDHLVIQPYNRDTAPGILLPLLHLQVQDANATVAVFPSDHFILEEEIFMAHVLQAAEFLEDHPGLLILMGIAPDRPETAYGWIEPGDLIVCRSGYCLFRVRGFREKPDPPKAERLYAQGGLWNSLVLLGQLPTLLWCIQKMLPELWDRFQAIRTALGTTCEGRVVEQVYRGLQPVNLSRHLLERIPDRLAVVPVRGVLWSDWGEEGRIFETLTQIGKAEELRTRLRRSAGLPPREAA